MTELRASGDETVELLLTFGGLLTLLLLSAFSCARSYFQNGRLRGMEEAIRELSRGLNSHYGNEESPPQSVVAALEKVKAAADKNRRPNDILTQRYHAERWSLGDAI